MKLECVLKKVACHSPSGTHQMAYWQWGNASARHVVVCVHGLTRLGRDFDVLAQTLCEELGEPVRVICPDVAGRGDSDWLSDPMCYGMPQYTSDMRALLLALQAEAPIQRLDWIGTSMGGLIGMLMASMPNLALPKSIDRLVLNDVGPTVEWEALSRIGSYVGKEMVFPSFEALSAHLRVLQAGFGLHTDAQWQALTRPMAKFQFDGTWALHYDPAIAKPFALSTPELAQVADVAMWQVYENIQAQVLLLRGEQSDLLSPQTAKRMSEFGPKASWVEVPDVGHAPTLLTPEQIEPILSFLK